MPSWADIFRGWFRPKPPPVRPPVKPPVGPPDPGRLDEEWLDALNAERSKVGLAPMVTDILLTDSAQAWASQMAANGQLQHGDFAGRIEAVHPDTAASEDVAEGYSEVAGVCAAWMCSPLHRANMLGNFNRTGIGRAESPRGVTFWTADFVMIS
jgi:uncharacterized protein YkwD